MKKCKKCSYNCKFGGWQNNGFCGAQHIKKNMKECGTYQFLKLNSKGDPVYKCNVCGSNFTG